MNNHGSKFLTYMKTVKRFLYLNNLLQGFSPVLSVARFFTCVKNLLQSLTPVWINKVSHLYYLSQGSLPVWKICYKVSYLYE